MRRKYFSSLSALILMSVIILAIFPAGAQKKTITFWQPPTAANPELDEQFWKETIAAFEKENPDLQVQFVSIPWKDAYTKWVAAIESGEVPEMTSSGSEATVQFAALGEVLPVDDVIQELGGEDAYNGSLRWYKWDNHYWGVPYIDGGHIMTYRKDLFDEIGIQPLNKWSDALEASKKLTVDINGDGRIDRWGFGTTYGRNNETNHYILFFQKAFGGGVLDKEGKVALDTTENAEALQFYTDLLLKHKVVPPGAPSYTSFDLNILYGNGQLGMYTPDGMGPLYLKQNFPDTYEKSGFSTLPKGPTGLQGTYGVTNPLWIFKKSKNPEAAKHFIRFLMRPEIHTKWIQISGWVSPFRAINERPEFKDIPYFKSIADSLNFSVRNGAEYGPHPMNGVIEGQLVLVDMVQDVVVRNMPVLDVIKKYQKTLEEMYSREPRM